MTFWLSGHITYDIITGITFIAMLWMLAQRHRKIKNLKKIENHNNRFHDQICHILFNTKINDKTEQENRIIKVLRLLKDRPHTDFRYTSYGFRTDAIYHDKNIVIAVAGGNTNEYIKIHDNDTDKDILWISGVMKFIYKDGREFILHKHNTQLFINSGEHFIAKAAEDNTLLLTVIRP